MDSVIASLKPLLAKGDILIDCGNSYYEDTQRRMQSLQQDGFYLIGSGVSGGEKGALHGPSIMPSGEYRAYCEIADIFTAIAAKNEDGTACCTYIGKEGSGHFVKMVHNGIEYADMQLLAELYAILKRLYPKDRAAVQKAFHQLNQHNLASYLLDITEDILQKKEQEEWLLDKVLDVAKQKGTGKWTACVSLEYGVPVPSLIEAVEARFLSSMKAQRLQAEQCYAGTQDEETGNEQLAADLYKAVLLAKTSIYAQGFSLIAAVNAQCGYHIDTKQLAVIWQNGCIIKSEFLKDIYQAYDKDANLTNLLVSDQFTEYVKQGREDLQRIISFALQKGLYIPVLCSAMNYVNGYTTASLETNLIQAQRDCFGAHTYERVDQAGVFHSDWLK
ncbi:MAG: NADP-dependent phosphogluconate dehydrogenase [[Clostridium] innocuum]|nr:NADP-dependent phosphogluconate dehydrogenase [[Clostridium] innocuum]